MVHQADESSGRGALDLIRPTNKNIDMHAARILCEIQERCKEEESSETVEGPGCAKVHGGSMDGGTFDCLTRSDEVSGGLVQRR